MVRVFRLLSCLPLVLLQTLGAMSGWLAFLLSPVYRRRFLDNSRQAGYPFSTVRPAIAQIGRMVGELPRLWLGQTPPYEWDNVACIDAAYARHAGVVFLTPHLGCFEVAAQALAQRYGEQYGPLTVLFRPARKAYLRELTEMSRQRPGLETAPTNLAGVRQMIKALRQGRAIGLLPDQVPPDGMGLLTPFFGREAYTMTLAARLVQQTGAELRLIWGERLPWGRGFRLHCREMESPLSADTATAVAQMNQEIERMIRECPQQYLWSYARYKQPRTNA